MSNRKDIENLRKLSEKATKQMNLQMKMLDSNFEGLMKSLPEDEAKKVNSLQVLSKKAFALAKSGRIEDAENLIKDYRDGSKS